MTRAVEYQPIFAEPAIRQEPLTEAGAAERFARLYGDVVRFDHRRQRWLLWEGHRWAPDADAEILRRWSAGGSSPPVRRTTAPA